MEWQPTWCGKYSLIILANMCRDHAKDWRTFYGLIETRIHNKIACKIRLSDQDFEVSFEFL